MTLDEFKTYVLAFAPGTVFPYSLSEPFAWPGSPDEVAFTLIDSKANREYLLFQIEAAHDNTFLSAKGIQYHYDWGTKVHFEASGKRWTNGEYVLEMTSRIRGYVCEDKEMELVKLAFPVGDTEEKAIEAQRARPENNLVPVWAACEFAEYFRNNFEYYDVNSLGALYRAGHTGKAMHMKDIFEQWQKEYGYMLPS